MSSYIIRGGTPLSGTMRASGNKNAALPCIAAALLTDEPVLLKNLPDIEDVRVMLSTIEALGAEVKAVGAGNCQITVTDISGDIPEDLAGTIRASILFAGPLLARTGRVKLSPPGGDVIGLRRLDTHFLAFEALGATSLLEEGKLLTVSAPANGLQSNEVFLDEMSVTATENCIMAAVLAEGTSVITNAASEPHVQDLCRMLNTMGARIDGVGSNRLTVTGVTRVHGTEFSIGSDLMEIGSFIGLAAATCGELVIQGVNAAELPMIRNGFAKIGVKWECSGSSLRVPAESNRIIQPDISGMIPKIDDAPWPGFPADLLSIISIAATQSEGTILVHEKMFESRMFFIDMLIRMGARIILCDPHRAVVTGASALQGTLVTSPDIRAGMALVIAALAAKGKSVIQNVYQIERGYENLCKKLQSVGADIVRSDNAGEQIEV